MVNGAFGKELFTCGISEAWDPLSVYPHQAYHQHGCLNVLIICTESQVQSERRYVKTLVSHTWVGHVADF